MTDNQKLADYEAREARLGRIRDSIDRGPESQFYGADFQLGFGFMFGELVELQREFNERFAKDMPGDPRFAEFYDRIIQIMESSEKVLIDSVGSALAKLKEGQKQKAQSGKKGTETAENRNND